MVAQVFTEKTTIGDLIRYERDFQYTRESAVIHNRSNAALTLNNPMGYPLVVDESVAGDYQFAAAAGAANVVALLLSTKKIDAIADNATIKAAVIVRGPIIVAEEFIPVLDYAGAAITIATVKTALQARIPPILVRAEHDVTTTQTT